MATDQELRLRERLTRLRNLNLLGGTRLSGELEKLQRQLERIQSAPTDEEIWRSVELARHQDRPYTLDYVERLLEDWVELHGDRGRADDAALVIGLGRFDGRTVALVGNQKGRDIKERTHRNFGMAYPEGYRKAMRLMEVADRHGFPLISLVDIPGAYPGVAAEQHGQGGAIARAQSVMARLSSPSLRPVPTRIPTRRHACWANRSARPSKSSNQSRPTISSVGAEPSSAPWAFTPESTVRPVDSRELHGAFGRILLWTSVTSPHHPQRFPPTPVRLRAGNPARRVDPPAGWRSFSEDRNPPLK